MPQPGLEDQRLPLVVEALEELGGSVEQMKDLVAKVGVKINKGSFTARKLVLAAQEAGVIVATEQISSKGRPMYGYKLPDTEAGEGQKGLF